MVEILRNKRLATRFQVLVEIADKGPFVKQKQIAHELGITPQAVSDYIARLVSDGMLVVEAPSGYRLSAEAVNWVIKTLREVGDYTSLIQRAITNIATSTAIAADDIKKGAKVNLIMKDGLLYATTTASGSASGIAATSASRGQDIGITAIVGIVDLSAGTVEIFKVPGVENGGSEQADYNTLRTLAEHHKPVFSLGIEAFVVCGRWGGVFQHFGVVNAAVEAARSGLNPLVVCVEGESAGLVKHLADAGISYRITE